MHDSNGHPTSDARGLVISRRTALQHVGAGVLLAMGRWPGALAAQASRPPAGEFRFVVVNDTHYMSPEYGEWLERAVRQMQSEQPEFILHAGDLVERGHREHLLIVRDIFAATKIPCYFQIGNHDHLGKADRTAYEELFPNRVNYQFEHRDWQFIGVDTCQVSRSSDVRISDQTLRWVKDRLPQIDRERPLVLFTHFPLAEGVRYRPRNAEALLTPLLPYNLQGVFGGPYHGYTERVFGRTNIVTNRCCALKRKNHDDTPEKGFFACLAKAGRISRRFVEIV